MSFLTDLFNSSNPTTAPVIAPILIPAVIEPTVIDGTLAKVYDVLKVLCPNLAEDKLQAWTSAFQSAMIKAQVNTDKRISAMLGQIVEESGAFTELEESLYYTHPERLMTVWPSRFPTIDVANQYICNPQKLANHVYCNRMGNGDESSNDGWNYRGRGPLQTTGKDDYQSLANYAGIALEAVGDWLKTPEGGATATCWEWTRGNLNSYADTWNLHDMTRIINGGYTNLQDRISLCNKALGVFS